MVHEPLLPMPEITLPWRSWLLGALLLALASVGTVSLAHHGLGDPLTLSAFLGEDAVRRLATRIAVVMAFPALGGWLAATAFPLLFWDVEDD